jgi:hypothetical protein
MIEEAIKALIDVGLRTAEPDLISVGDSRRLAYVVNGEVETYEREPAPRDHKAGTLADLIKLADRFNDDADRPVVWYGKSEVVLVIDDSGHRLEKATLTLAPSAVFARVKALAAKPERFEHKPFLRLLRVDLAGTIAPAELYDRVKRVTFENGLTVRADVSRNKSESMGRDITSKVSGEGDVPEEVVLMLPVYSTPGERERYALRCAVEVDPAEGSFRLTPMPDEIERVEALAVASIGQRLAVLVCPTYFGQP